jgi:hypothetical protein
MDPKNMERKCAVYCVSMPVQTRFEILILIRQNVFGLSEKISMVQAAKTITLADYCLQTYQVQLGRRFVQSWSAITNHGLKSELEWNLLLSLSHCNDSETGALSGGGGGMVS